MVSNLDIYRKLSSIKLLQLNLSIDTQNIIKNNLNKIELNKIIDNEKKIIISKFSLLSLSIILIIIIIIKLFK